MPFAHREPKVYVAKSRVSGLGVFTKCSIRPGETICLYSGVCLGSSAMIGNNSDYVLDLENGHFLDGASKFNCSGRYINDARGTGTRSNAIYSSKLLWDEELGWYVHVKAKRHIAPHREVFASYGNAYWQRRTGVYGANRRKGINWCYDTATAEQLEALDRDIGILD